MAIIIESDLKEFLIRFENKIDKIDERITKLEDKFEDKFTKFEDKFTKLEEKFEERFTKLEEKFEEKFTKLEEKFEERFTKLENNVDKLDTDFNQFKLEVTRDMTEVKTNLATFDELKITQKNQLWAIISLFGAVVIATLVRFVFEGLSSLKP